RQADDVDRRRREAGAPRPVHRAAGDPGDRGDGRDRARRRAARAPRPQRLRRRGTTMRRRSVPAVPAALVLGSCAGSRVAVDSLEWRLQTSAVGLGLRGLSVVDARTAWASGTDGTFARTIDGNAWEFGRIAEAQGRDLRDVHAFDRDHAIVMAVGEPARFWRTSDGGATWQLVHDDATPGLFFDGIAFADARRGYAFSDPVEGAFVVLRSL